ncbi:MAG: DUF2244 domain-containing protein [Proteobacteria bacterium]|nr:DUF2244 domain-containing protein [Pseudomonadota bacterium]
MTDRVATDGGAQAHTWRVELLPHCSLTPAQARGFFGLVAATSLTVAGFFVANGYWPVLPFAGLELALLAFALATSLKRRHYVQTVEISETEIRVTTRGPKAANENQFSRHWARVTLHGPHGWRAGRLLIESHGRACEIGAFLTEDERRALGRRLTALVGRTSESPRLPPD